MPRTSLKWKQVADRLDRLEVQLGRDPVQAAVAAAMRRTVYRAKASAIERLGDHFTIRSTFPRRGIRVRVPYREHPIAKMEAAVGTIDQWMADHEASTDGGERSAGRARRRWIPLAARPTPETITTRKVQPRALLRAKTQPRAFLVDRYDARLVGRREGRSRYPVEWLWREAATNPQDIPGDWPFVGEAAFDYERLFLPRLEAELDKLARKAIKV